MPAAPSAAATPPAAAGLPILPTRVGHEIPEAARSQDAFLAAARAAGGDEPDRPAPGDHAILMAFGPGLTTEAALVRF